MHIKSAKGLPRALSHFVFCQYVFYGESEAIIVPPCVETSRYAQQPESGGASFIFDHRKVLILVIGARIFGQGLKGLYFTGIKQYCTFESD